MSKFLPLKLTGIILIILFLGFISVVLADVPRTLYIMNGSAETLSKMSLEDQSIVQNIMSTGQVPNQIVTHNQMLYLLNSGVDDIRVIDPQNNHQVVKTIALETGNNPWAMAFAGTNKAYVTNFLDNSVSVVDVEAGVVTKTIPVGTGPEGILIHENQAFIANTGYSGAEQTYGQASVSIINILTDSVTHTVDVPANAQDLEVDPSGRINVVCTGNYVNIFGQIAIIDLYTGPAWDTPAVIDTIEIGGSPGDIAIAPSGKGYCVAWGDGTNGFLYSYSTVNDSLLHGVDNPILIGPNVSRLLYDGQENVLWIPYMTVWGGDGFVQKLDVDTDSVIWTSGVVGNGTQDLAILEPIFTSDPWADAVVSFTPGTGAGFGENYFPANVLGPPDPDAGLSETNPTTKPQELLSLGNGGVIILEFTDNYIIDGEGADFTVFENAFLSLWTGEPFIEAGIVAVSMDGENFVEFPYDTSTWAGLAGVTPTKDNQNPTDPTVSGGDQFDLADVGLSYAKFVKITDLGDIKSEGDWNFDFDLDAVVAINSQPGGPTTVSTTPTAPAIDFHLAQNYPNPFNPETTISFSLGREKHVELKIFNHLGQEVQTLVNERKTAGTHHVLWNGRDIQGNVVASGMYFYRLKSGDEVKMRKMILMK